MRVLWISSRVFEAKEETQSGVWIKALATKLVKNQDIILGNVSVKRGNKQTEFSIYDDIMQWALPYNLPNKKGYPSKKTELRLKKIIKDFHPDIIQVWGSENPFKLLPFKKDLPGIKVLTMQGILASIAPNLLLGLSFKELLSTIGIREIILGKNLFSEKRSFISQGIIESEMISKCNFIITQSDWTDSQIININPAAKLYRTQRVLRSPFITNRKWGDLEHSNPIIYSASLGYSLKGLHILIKALSLVKKQYPVVELRIAGLIGRTDYLGDGYSRMIIRMINNYGLRDNVKWLGALTATEIVKNLQEASVFVNPSFIESYSLSLAEAMSVGTPSVVSFAGAMPELAEPGKEALFFTPGDYKQCAWQIIRLLKDQKFSEQISKNSIARSEERYKSFDTVAEQYKIYEDVLSQYKSKNSESEFQ